MTGKLRIAVGLSGCGVYDGSEIHEAVLTLLAIDRNGASYQCFAPDIPQVQVVNHLTGKASQETRNVLVESARIARGSIKDLREYRAADFDGLIFPGGFGAAKNLSSFAFDGSDCTVNDAVAHAIRDTKAAGKPIGALCIAPAVVAKVLGRVDLTIGSDPGTAAALEAMGAHHRKAGHGEVVVDRAAKVVTTPCYMLDSTISQIAQGAEAVVKALLTLAREG
ncbi:MAG: isoprenoid biosynthesis glyoxalase ElbB [Alphaproteobacteria bacterium]|nr:isoprenoid biosynthesis glyoxalase ElbB [Alphaproteobacteria bacterium]